MVGDDHLHTGRAGGRDLVRTRDPAVGGDQECGAPGREALHTVVGEAVPVAQAVGDVPVAPRPEPAQSAHQDRGRRDPVAVVVAVDRDRPPGRNGLLDRPGDLAHRFELEWIVALRRLQERTGIGDGPIPPPDQRHGHRFRQVQVLHQDPCLRVAEWLELERPCAVHSSEAKNARGRNSPLPPRCAGPRRSRRGIYSKASACSRREPMA
jgi:hypothetical protein